MSLIIKKAKMLPLVLLTLTISCANKENRKTKIKFSDPIYDARFAVSRNDFHLIALQGIAPYVPGVDGDFEDLKLVYTIDIDDNTSDMFEVGDERRSQLKIYATNYNKYIMRSMGCNPVRPLTPCKRGRKQ